MSILPTINIQYSSVFRETYAELTMPLKLPDYEFKTDEEYEKKVASFRAAWQPYEQKILEGMCGVLGTSFKANFIRVFAVPMFLGGMSAPLIINIDREDNRLINTLTHELIHVLLNDMSGTDIDSERLKMYEDLYGTNHSETTLVHIPVHSVLREIYVDVLDELERFEFDKAHHAKRGAVDYVKAWEYVEANDYKEINKQLRESFGKS